MSVADQPRFAAILSAVSDPRCRKYPHWDKLIRYHPPEGITLEEWWWGIKVSRIGQLKPIPLEAKDGRSFTFALPDPIPEHLHHIDQGAGGFIRMPDQVLNPQTRDQYYVRSIIEEAITSSQLEGATTSRKIAKEMIQSNRPPRDRSERMIHNNYLAMKRITDLKDQPLSPELILHIHRIVTDQTLDDPAAAGRFRRSDENIAVVDNYNQVMHTPPHADQLPDRTRLMCDFANDNTPSYFIHPVIRSIMLHFWLGYDHPFVDGNGRTARALFYWSMLRHSFWLCEFISISTILLKAPSKYGRSFLYTETDDNDLTYFLLHNLDVIRRAVSELHEYIKRKTEQLGEVDAIVKNMPMNHRQRALLGHALRHPHQRYTIEAHRMSHDVVHQTARTDLLELHRLELLSGQKVGKTWYFVPSPDLHDKLSKLGGP